MHSIRYYSKGLGDFYPSSSIKLFRKSKSSDKPAVTKRHSPLRIQSDSKDPSLKKFTEEFRLSECSEEYAENAVKVQLISKNLYDQIFRTTPRKSGVDEDQTIKYVKELLKHGIDVTSTERLPDVHIKLPPLHGEDIEDHFYAIAKEQISPYVHMLTSMLKCTKLPSRPRHWEFQSGWTIYDAGTGNSRPVDYPLEDALVLDVEVCVIDGAAPTLATAVSNKHWYSWVSPKLVNNNEEGSTDPMPRTNCSPNRYTLSDLIPLGKNKPKIIVGHNVAYDRARIREQYLLEDSGTRFLDTMSLHISVSGITSYQRAMLKSKKLNKDSPEDFEWLSQSSLNSLQEVYSLYCGGKPLSKELRNIFLEGNLSEIRANFQSLISYCANDVEATHSVYSKLYPLFTQRFPHPATLAGMLEISAAYLPVNSNWQRYLNEANLAYEDLNIEAKYHLSRRADETCALLRNEAYRKHLWLWDEDWSIKELKLKKQKSIYHHISTESISNENTMRSNERDRLRSKFQYLYNLKDLLPARRPLLPGYPEWYRKLCQKPPKNGEKDNKWVPGAFEISTGMQIAPKLLSLCWEGYPLHYIKDHGWGFLVPFRRQNDSDAEEEATTHRIPIKELINRCPIPDFARNFAGESESDYAFRNLRGEIDKRLGRREYYIKTQCKKNIGQYQGTGVWCNTILENCCFFFRLPHKNGTSYRVGNPLSRDFLNKFSENVLSSAAYVEGSAATRVIEIARMMSYWRNNRDRIMGQFVVWLPNKENLGDETSEGQSFGAICPQIVVCGTLTRRAMEPTWLTASNAQHERIGSELRSMVQAPKNYKIVGADVDSQELWIASVLGDAYASDLHGTTPLGWMTLSGSKSKGTDMHSITAKAIGISRDQAKVINYARIYGAGQNFAESLLKQFNPSLSTKDVKNKAMKMFSITKGKRIYRIREEFQDQHEDKDYSGSDVQKIALTSNRSIEEMFYKPRWIGGSESAMFNCLEEIALSKKPVTPFLGCRLSRAIESNSGNEKRFLPTRVNWVVQSGAVDFLHLMLVSMRWLMGPHVRFCISFHDEVRYLVKDELAYKAALAMHITNLLTRAFCASRIGLKDLPMSVAFFSSVEVDSVLRKESTMDCKTPSNPHGLKIGYSIPLGESLNVFDAIRKAGGNDLSKWDWIK